MAITIQKTKKAAPLPKVEHEVEEQQGEKAVEDYTLEELADAYGSLEDQIKAIKLNPAFTKFEMVQKELAKRLKDEMEAEDEAELQGQHWVLEIGAAAKNNRFLKDGAIPKLQAFLGVEAFGKIAKANISDIEKYCTPEQVEQLIESDTGFSDKRKITAKYLG